MAECSGRPKGHKFCLNHLTKELTFVCETCGILVCNSCISADHKGHTFIELTEAIKRKFKFLQDFKTKSETEVIPDIQKYVTIVEEMFTNTEKNLRAEISNVEEQEKALHKSIDIWKLKTVAEFETIIDINKSVFKEFVMDYEKPVIKLKEMAKETTNAAKSESNVLIWDTASEVSSFKFETPPMVAEMTNAHFVPVLDKDHYFEDILTSIGEVQRELVKANRGRDYFEQIIGQNKPNIFDTEINLPKEADQHLFASNLPKTGAGTVSRSDADPNASVLNLSIGPMKLGFNPTSIVHSLDGALWMCRHTSNGIRRKDVDKPIAIFRINDYPEDVTDIAIHPTTCQLYCLNSGLKTFKVRTMEATTGNTTLLFEAKQKTLSPANCIAVTKDDNLLIGHSSKDIYRYNAIGHILKKAKVPGDETSMRIAVCRSSGNVAVACCTLEPTIQVLDDQLDILFCCKTGPSVGLFGTSTIDVKFDEYGYILVSHTNNKSIFILSSKYGQLHRAIVSEISHFKGKLRCIAPSSNGSLYACFDDQIITINYLK